MSEQPDIQKAFEDTKAYRAAAAAYTEQLNELKRKQQEEIADAFRQFRYTAADLFKTFVEQKEDAAE